MQAFLNELAFEVAFGRFSFHWDLARDHARVLNADSRQEIWSGSLFPLWWIQGQDGVSQAVQPQASRALCSDDRLEVELDLGQYGTASLSASLLAAGISIDHVAVQWTRPATPVIGMYFGCQLLTTAQRSAVPTLDRPFWPNWRAEGFGIASAKTSPMQSFFRRWDFGHTTIPLGSFGPAMGTPYAAAFPRPLYAGCMGGRHGWVCLGAGCVPDAALSWQVRSSSGAQEWLYREDLWQAPVGSVRNWTQPLRLLFADSAWLAYREYFRSLGGKSVNRSSLHQKSFWGTWGDFRFERFDIPAAIDRALDEVETPLVCIDDPWESFTGSGIPHPQRLPTFADDIAYGHKRGAQIGIWTSLAWIARPDLAGLDDNDLILSRDGAPIKGMWCMDPHDPERWCSCMDPSSARVRDYIRERTKRFMRLYRPTLLKIDFGYGVPGPDACAPRDPQYRGERLGFALAELVAGVAREIDATVTIMYVTLSPLWDHIQDLCGMDDLGDAGHYEASGHGHWSVWAALLGDRGVGIMASSGYDWMADADVLLDTAVIGAPGANLPRQMDDGSSIPPAFIARRRALARWYRRTTYWTPRWWNSSSGSLAQEPEARSWGRLELVNGAEVLTAVALRGDSAETAGENPAEKITWQGRWALIAQTLDSVFVTAELACIPFGPGWISIARDRPTEVLLVNGHGHSNCKSWSWADGQLTVEISAEMAASDLLGVLIRSDS